MPARELGEVRDALAADDRGRVVELVDPLVEAFDERRDREAMLSTFARNLDATAPADSEAERAAVEALQAAREAATARTQLTTTLAGYVNEQRDAATVLDATDTAATASEAVESAADSAHDAASDVDLPPALFLSGPDAVQLPKGTDLDVRLTLDNVGTDAAEAVSVEATAPVDVSVTSTDVGTLDGGATATMHLVGAPSTAETTTVSVIAEGAETLDSLDVDVTVISWLGYLERAQSRFHDLLSDIERMRVSDDAQGDGWFQGRREEVESMTERLDRHVERIKSGDTSDTERRVQRLQDKLEKFRERIERKAQRSDRSGRENGNGDREKQEVTPADTKLLVSDVTAISTTLERSLYATL